MAQDWHHLSTQLVKNGALTIPHPSTVQTWEDDMTKWPNVSCANLLLYLTDSTAVDGNRAEALKSVLAYQYLHSEKVGRVLIHKQNSFVYLKGSVEPSQCINNEAHKAWVLLTEDGSIETAGCTCVAGPGRVCSHAAAILFKVCIYVFYVTP